MKKFINKSIVFIAIIVTAGVAVKIKFWDVNNELFHHVTNKRINNMMV